MTALSLVDVASTETSSVDSDPVIYTTHLSAYSELYIYIYIYIISSKLDFSVYVVSQ